jgi:hypothetical protein
MIGMGFACFTSNFPPPLPPIYDREALFATMTSIFILGFSVPSSHAVLHQAFIHYMCVVRVIEIGKRLGQFTHSPHHAFVHVCRHVLLCVYIYIHATKVPKCEKIISGQLSGMPGSRSIPARRQKPLKIISKYSLSDTAASPLYSYREYKLLESLILIRKNLGITDIFVEVIEKFVDILPKSRNHTCNPDPNELPTILVIVILWQ